MNNNRSWQYAPKCNSSGRIFSWKSVHVCTGSNARGETWWAKGFFNSYCKKHGWTSAWLKGDRCLAANSCVGLVVTFCRMDRSCTRGLGSAACWFLGRMCMTSEEVDWIRIERVLSHRCVIKPEWNVITAGCSSESKASTRCSIPRGHLRWRWGLSVCLAHRCSRPSDLSSPCGQFPALSYTDRRNQSTMDTTKATEEMQFNRHRTFRSVTCGNRSSSSISLFETNWAAKR